MFRRIKTLAAKLPVNHNYANALLTGYGLTGITIVVQLVMVPLYLKYLGTEKFGILVMILAANSYAALGIGWLSGGMARILAEHAALNDTEGFKAGYAFAKWLYLTYATVAVIIFWAIAPVLLNDRLQDSETLTALILASLYLIMMYEYNADRVAFNARHWQAKNNFREISGQIVFAATVFACLNAGFGLPSVIGAQILGILTTRVLAWLYWNADAWKLKWALPTTHFKPLWQRVTGKMGRDYIIYGVLILTLQADALILGLLLDPETVAHYYLIWRIPEVIILLLWRIPGSYGPFLIAMDAKGEHQRLQQHYKKGLFLMSTLAGMAALLYGALGQHFVNWWVGDKASSDGFSYVIAAAAMFFLAVARWPSSVAYSLINTAPLNLIIATELVAKLTLVFLLIEQFDFTTPMVATVIVHGLLIFYLYLKLGKDTLLLSASRSSNIRNN